MDYNKQTVYNAPGVYKDAGGGGGGGGVPVEYWELEYLQIKRDNGGANFVFNIPTFSNKDKLIEFIFEMEYYVENTSRDLVRIQNNNSNPAPGIYISYNIRNTTETQFQTRNSLADYTTPYWNTTLDNYKVKISLLNNSAQIETGAGTTLTSSTNYSVSTGFYRVFMFTDRSNPGEYHQAFGKFYKFSVQDVCNIVPVKRKGDNVIGIFDLVSNTFYAPNYGGSNIIAGPIVF